jgi:hypothetical protein
MFTYLLPFKGSGQFIGSLSIHSQNSATATEPIILRMVLNEVPYNAFSHNKPLLFPLPMVALYRALTDLRHLIMFA